jgi:hypothetical protein
MKVQEDDLVVITDFFCTRHITVFWFTRLRGFHVYVRWLRENRDVVSLRFRVWRWAVEVIWHA